MSKVCHDVTLDLHAGMLLFPGDPEIEIHNVSSILRGDSYNLSSLCFGSHTGTHIDAPRHFFDDGLSIDKLCPDRFIGKARVLEISGRQEISRHDLSCREIEKDCILVLKTGNSALLREKLFNKGYTYLTPEAAEYLVETGIKTLGFDYLTVEKYGSDIPLVHHILLKAGIPIIEGLDLNGVEPGEYQIAALPLKIKGGDGSPARVFLIEE